MTTRNRGKEGSDDKLFGTSKMQQLIKEALQDMSYLLSRDYADKSAVQLVGNRYRLNVRQQKAIRGMSASVTQVEQRKLSELSVNQLVGREIMIDGFNLLIVLESALSGAYLFKGMDNCYRDLSGVHGSYKRVQQTEKALLLIGDFLKECAVGKVTWVFDKPVSNSGRLKTRVRELAEAHGFNWEVILDNNPDKLLAESNKIAISSDAWILDRAKRWFNLAGDLIENKIEITTIIESY
ncbi:MAG: hypothetical protein COA88_01580 [Kordia sp.]|nr:MAG: hypothetical protein COA88_01580 [Kordia sp.]